ncbi:HNH endonuclease, partial [Klebsiella pneumoniae]|uniref:HNH endonuclease n=1 Tax=Klebsiella pneumoniae TaxID=573 RepID=UPI003969B30B
VYEHRVVGEDTIGRSLYDDEEVHHLDENKLNNHPDNLLILPQSQHLKLHAWMKRLAIDPSNYLTYNHTIY